MSARPESPRSRRWPVVIAILAAAPWSCTDATDVELLEISAAGALFGQVFLDLDGNGALSAGDEPVREAEVLLVTSGVSSDVVDQAATDSAGAFELLDVPVGSYRLTLGDAVLGDSLSTLGGGEPVTVAQDDTMEVTLGAGFAHLTLEDALLAPPGRRLFTSGIALNSRPNFGDGQVHFKGTSAYLRGLDVARGSLTPGDSVRLLGRAVVDNGRPALRDVTFFVLVSQAKLVTPVDVSTGGAATAAGGALDAAIARIRRAEITDTSTTPEGHFRFWADDGTDSVEFVIRDFLVPSINTSLFRPDTVVRIDQATGLLSPYDDGSGAVRWRFLLRGGGDFVLQDKRADIAVTTSFDVAQASLGDVVEIRVTVSNAGPNTATQVQARDTIPSGLAFVSATSTLGSYDSSTGVWNVGTMASGAAETLRITAEVTVAGPATVTNIVESLGLVREVDTNSNNNATSAAMPIS
jgi:uncharacterized repeat protein (TIGR01451 family)